MYIGTQPYQGFRARHTYTATAGQTSFSGAGAENVTLTYSDEMYIDVYQNGVKLSPADYTATSGTTVVLATGATVSDIVEVVKYDAFSVADTVSAKDGGGFGGNISTSGTLAVTGTSTLTGNVTAAGRVIVDDTTDATSTTDGSLQTDGGLSVVKDIVAGDDVKLLSDSAVLSFGADSDTTLTHTDGTGLTLNSTNKLTFGDAATFIHQSSDGVMTIDGEATIDLNASTAVLVSNDLKLNSDAAVLGFGADNDVTLTHVADTALLLNSSRQLQFGDSGTHISQSADGVLDLVSDTEIEINATTIDINGDVEISGTTAQVGVSTSTAKDIFNAGMSVKNGSTSAGFVEFFEDSDNGTNKVTVIGPSSTSDVTLTLPSSAGTIATTATAADEATALAIALG